MSVLRHPSSPTRMRRIIFLGRAGADGLTALLPEPLQSQPAPIAFEAERDQAGSLDQEAPAPGAAEAKDGGD